MVAALITVGLPVAAQEVSCVDAQSQADMTACAEQDWQAQDEALNEAYGHAMRAMKTLDAALPKGEQGAATALKRRSGPGSPIAMRPVWPKGTACMAGRPSRWWFTVACRG
jgi:hypothetical protein